MKQVICALSILMMPLLSWSATTVNCDEISANPSSRMMSLFVVDAKIIQVRIQSQGTRPHAFSAQEVQKNDHSTFYKLNGIPELMEVENSILADQGGYLTLQGLRFSCQ